VSGDAVGERRFSARCMGRKMPAPGTEVLKYCTLLGGSALWSQVVSHRLGDKGQALPIDITIILPSGREFSPQLYTHKLPVLASHAADELDSSIHIARDVDRVAHLQVAHVHLASRRCSGMWIPRQCPRTPFSIDRGAGAETRLLFRRVDVAVGWALQTLARRLGC